jgi:WXG100 family type VII secretion target
MPRTSWTPEVIQDVIGALNKAATDIEDDLQKLDVDIKQNLDFDNWKDSAHDEYLNQQDVWNKAATEMHRLLGEGAVPTLNNMHENLVTTEDTNRRMWNGVY